LGVRRDKAALSTRQPLQPTGPVHHGVGVGISAGRVKR
jgi:hypothetical protein